MDRDTQPMDCVLAENRVAAAPQRHPLSFIAEGHRPGSGHGHELPASQEIPS